MLFDPAKNIAAYQRFADAHGCAIVKTFETHRQADYISGSPGLKKATGAEIMAPEPDFAEARFAYTPVADGAVYAFQRRRARGQGDAYPRAYPRQYLLSDRRQVSYFRRYALYRFHRPSRSGRHGRAMVQAAFQNHDEKKSCPWTMPSWCCPAITWTGKRRMIG